MKNASITLDSLVNKTIDSANYSIIDYYNIDVNIGYNLFIFPNQTTVNFSIKICFQTYDSQLAFNISNNINSEMIMSVSNNQKSLSEIIFNNSSLKFLLQMIYQKKLFNRNCSITAVTYLNMIQNVTATEYDSSLNVYFSGYQVQATVNITSGK